MLTVNEKELKEVGLTPVDYIVARFQSIFKDDKNKTLVCVIDKRADGKGYLLGLATRDERGYQSLGMILEEHNYNIANGWVSQANKEIFNRDDKEDMMIVISSMRK